MKQSNERRNIAGQSNNAQQPQRHDVNLQKNSMLYFQIGLIVCLLAVYGLFEMRFEKKIVQVTHCPPFKNFEDSTVIIDKFKIFEDIQSQKLALKKEQKILAKAPVVKPNDFKISVPKEILTGPETTNQIADIGDIKVDDGPIDTPEIFNIIDVEKVPIYPGCESAKTNDQRIKCMSEKLAKLVQNTFNQNLISEMGLYGLQKIDVQFTIDKKGNITNIKTRAPNVRLEKEALRVIKKIPNMKPGLQRARPVSVIYNLPIVLRVE